MRITLTVEVQDSTIDIDNYATAETPVSTVREAVEYDLNMFKAGEVSLEEVIYNFGGDVDIKVLSVEDTQEVQK